MRQTHLLSANRVEAARLHAAHEAIERAPPKLGEEQFQRLCDRQRLAVNALAAALVEDFAGVARLVLAASLYREVHGDPEFEMLIGAATKAARELLRAKPKAGP